VKQLTEPDYSRQSVREERGQKGLRFASLRPWSQIDPYPDEEEWPPFEFPERFVIFMDYLRGNTHLIVIGVASRYFILDHILAFSNGSILLFDDTSSLADAVIWTRTVLCNLRRCDKSVSVSLVKQCDPSYSMTEIKSHTHTHNNNNTRHLDFTVLGAFLDAIGKIVSIRSCFCFSTATRTGNRFVRVL
jgi:hypothetical protein